MRIQQIYTGCLAHAAYYISNKGEAAIFDPLREVQSYIDRAEHDQCKIKYVFETHFHADFVSGHLNLQEETGATIVFGPTATPDYDALIAKDGQEFKVGDYTIRAIHTPGHTMESTTYLLIDENGKEHGLITGDTLFIGDVGRPDLAQHVASELTEEKLAGHLYDSLRNKIMPLSDHLVIYPNHGAGSACGKKMSQETTDTLGNQKRTNYALRADMTKEEFIKEVLDGLTTPPLYFPQNVMMNIKGYDSAEVVMQRAMTPLNTENFEAVVEGIHALVLDTRNPEDFAKGFIPNSINIGLNGSFAQWVGELIPDVKQEMVLVCEPGTEIEAVTRLSRVGYDYALGFLLGGFQSWKDSGKDYDSLVRISSEEFEKAYKDEGPLIIDVRKKSEFDAQHVIGALNIPLNSINNRLDAFPENRSFVLHCVSGYRSMIAASILKQRGWHNFVDVSEGFNGIKKRKVALSPFKEPQSLL